MTITTTFNKDLMALRDVKNMADTLESLIEFARDMGRDPSAENLEDFFWKFYNSTSHIEQGWRKS
jgi:hypothetical protein